MSKVTTVTNYDRKFGSSLVYYHIRADKDGKTREYLFTSGELRVAESRARNNLEDLPVNPRVKSFIRWLLPFAFTDKETTRPTPRESAAPQPDHPY
jgi:hypothetical protein